MSGGDLTLERCQEAVDSESAGAPYNADVWELRRRVNWLSARLTMDREQGIYRVSLDAAIEEAAKEFCRIHLGDVWDSITEPARDGYRDYFRSVLTAAVRGCVN